MKPTTNRQIAREWLAAQDGPRWGSEILAAMRLKGFNLRSSGIAEMVANGQLVKTTDANGVACYTIGKAPGYYSPEQIEARKEKRRAYDRVRSANRRLARGQQVRATKAKAPPKRAGIVLASSHNTRPGQSVEEFLAAGGRIERLPGLKTSNVYPARRPGMAPGMRVAP